MNRSFFAKAATVATLSFGVVAATATTASAQDRLNIVGSVNVRESGTGGENLFIDFLNPTLAIPSVDGAFEGEITEFVTTGTMNDVTVNSAGLVSDVPGFLTIGGYTFTLTSTPVATAGPFNFGPVALMTDNGNTSATISVNGTVTGGDYGASNRDFSGILTAQFAGESAASVFNSIERGGTRNVAFSGEFIVAPQQVVPEPSTYALLATGIGALGLVARRRRTQA